MISIVEQNTFVSKLLGKQMFFKDIKYRMLHFCITLSVDSGVLIFNNLTKEMLFISHEEVESLENITNFSANTLYISLIEKWFLVPENHDDSKIRDQIVNFSRVASKSDDVTNFVILPTTACNARCFYCFEAGAETKNMTVETAEDIVKYIEKKSNGKDITIMWFGGEPTCNIKVIDTICHGLKNKGVKFRSNMISNAFLFNDKIAKKSRELWNLVHIQITLDGLDETYNKIKNYVYKDCNPFEKVIENISLLLDSDVSVLVRLNMDNHNEAELHELVDYLYTKFGKYKKFNIYARLLYENVCSVGDRRTDIERKFITSKFNELLEHISRLGLYYRRPLKNSLKVYCCEADSPQTVLISPEGKLGYCQHYVDRHFYGDIYNDNKKGIWSKYADKIPECDTCPLYPTCFRFEVCVKECYDYHRMDLIKTLKNGMLSSYEAYKNGEK